MSTLSLSLLGSFRASLTGQALTKFRTSKVQALLIYLAVEAKLGTLSTAAPTIPPAIVHRREALMELLWPGSLLKSAQDNLRQTLYQLRKAIPELKIVDGDQTAPFLLTSHNSVQLNPLCDFDLDVAIFIKGFQVPPERARLEEAVALYHGDFLNDFYLTDSSEFEGWAAVQRAKLQRQLLDALHFLTNDYTELENYRQAEKHARRQLEVDPLREGAHRQLMIALAYDDRRHAALAQYDACRLVLNQELGLEPSEETAVLYEQIRSNELATSSLPPTPPVVRSIQPSDSFEQITKREDVPRPVFVARQRELKHVNDFLGLALQGHGRVIFVTGGAGRGKTALMNAFAQKAMDAYPDLIVGSGICNAYSGIGDPYLPFRDVMAMLTGDREAWGTSGTIGNQHARRLWAAFPSIIQALLDHGHHLLDIFVSGETLLSRAATIAAEGAPWFQRLAELIERQRAGSGVFEQSQLFQQYSNVLSTLSEQNPLLLLLDDMQWADAASISLLFHLGRRLEGSRILIICAYRPNEILLGRDGERHPLEKVLSELKRHYGDVLLNLSKIEDDEGRRFVDAFLETEPNQFGKEFRAALTSHTGGHPLFTIELLRAMKDRGDLIYDDSGYWTEGPSLDWETLPARVEAAIEERLHQLAPDLYELLTLASVEGESFTAQVLSRVQNMDERQILKALSQELGKRHRLIQEQGERQVGRRRLSRYRFAHALFHQFLYNNLSQGESRLLHREIGEALEALYEEHTEEIAVQLASHFAGDPKRELYYTRLAGDRAAEQFANSEALQYLSRALELTPEEDDDGRYTLLLLREEVYDIQGEREAQSQDINTLQSLVNALDDGGKQALRRRAQVALRQANYAQNISDFPAAIKANQEAIRLAQSAGDLFLQAAGHLQWGEGLWRLAEFKACRTQFKQALSLAKIGGFRHIEADSMRLLGNVAYYQGDYAGAIAYQEPSLHISREVGDRSGEASALSNLGEAARAQGDFHGAKVYYAQRLQICREIGERHGEDIALNNLGLISHNLGDDEAARDYSLQALHIGREIGNRSFQAYNLTNLGHALMGLGEHREAIGIYQQAITLRRELNEEHLAMEPIAGLARVFLAQANLPEAFTQVEKILSFLRTHSLDGTEEPLRVYLTCYRVLFAMENPRADDILDTAHTLLQERIKKIEDEALRNSFIENVPAHREISEAWRNR